MRVPLLLAVALLTAGSLSACKRAHSGPDNPGTATTDAASPAAAPATSAPATADPDLAAQGGAGVPPGYLTRTDEAGASIADAKYTSAPDGSWEVETGPAHILYKASDSASGTYTLSGEIDQLAAPRHPEAYGVFFGGQDLAGAGERYTYFLVRGNGMYAIKARNGADASTIVDFTPSANVPKADAAGKATYVITVRVAPDSIRFAVNGKPVAAIASKGLAVDGIAGLRINHNLHVMVKPLQIGR